MDRVEIIESATNHEAHMIRKTECDNYSCLAGISFFATAISYYYLVTTNIDWMDHSEDCRTLLLIAELLFVITLCLFNIYMIIMIYQKSSKKYKHRNISAGIFILLAGLSGITAANALLLTIPESVFSVIEREFFNMSYVLILVILTSGLSSNYIYAGFKYIDDK